MELRNFHRVFVSRALELQRRLTHDQQQNRYNSDLSGDMQKMNLYDRQSDGPRYRGRSPEWDRGSADSNSAAAVARNQNGNQSSDIDRRYRPVVPAEDYSGRRVPAEAVDDRIRAVRVAEPSRVTEPVRIAEPVVKPYNEQANNRQSAMILRAADPMDRKQKHQSAMNHGSQFPVQSQSWIQDLRSRGAKYDNDIDLIGHL